MGFPLKVLGRGQNFDENAVSAAGIDLGNGIAAIVSYAVSTTKTTVAATPAAAGSDILLVANPSRRAAVVVNNGSTNLHIIEDPSASIGDYASESVVAPGNSWDAQEAYQGIVYGWWEGTPTGSAAITEIVDATASSGGGGGGGGAIGTTAAPNVSTITDGGGSGHAATVSAGGALAVADATAETTLAAILANTPPIATATAAVAPAGATVKSSAGYLFAIVVTAIGTAAVAIKDGTGNTIAVIPANQPVGDVPLYGGARPFATSLVCPSVTGGPSYTIAYA